MSNGHQDRADSPPRSSAVRDLVMVLAAAWAVRLAFMAFVPAGARSFDAIAMEGIARVLKSGINPYQATTLLNWPPLWMQLVFCLSKVSTWLDVPFFRVLQVFLILVESAVIVQLYQLIREVAPAANARKIVLLGIALNPIAVLLVCQHCHFDVLVGLWLVLFARSLFKYHRTGDPAGWLAACLYLGLGILTKTVPLVLVPMLAGGFRQVTPSLKFIGAFLLLAPVTLGMSIIYVLAPDDVLHKVLLYRSQAGFFGISGLLGLAGAGKFLNLPSALFYLALAGVMAISANLFWRRRVGDKETLLLAALILAAIPGLGPGYAPQYIYWFLPLLVATYACYPGRWRSFLAGCAVVAVGTYLVEYALLPEFGFNLVYLFNPKAEPGNAMQSPLITNHPIVGDLFHETGHILLRLPLFIAYLLLFVFGARILLRELPELLPGRAARGLYAAAFVLVVAALVALGIGDARPQETRSGAAPGGMVPLTEPAFRERMDNVLNLNNLAWELATSPDVNVRDGPLAVRMAQRACGMTGYQEPAMVGTLAAAYAEAGRFSEAISTEEDACYKASQQENMKLLKQEQDFLALYKAHQPYHEPAK